MIKGINESKTLARHISCECICKFDGRKCNSRQKWSNDRYKHECKKPKTHLACEKDYIWNPSTCACKCDKDCKIGEYFRDSLCIKSLVDDLLVTCDEIGDR